ncbi:hypothetical protein [Glaciibacter superstes]|uniref:hypothetical protein n=1 Tax=Glaciibacter superstes TaxID=501023 RepID=UPI0003B696FF|nr:hypothetical protein [Glaciibacter superstes]
MTSYEILSVIIAGLGLAGGAVGFIRALAADRRSIEAEAAAGDARSDAAAALEKSASATERIAEAVEFMARRSGDSRPDTLLAAALPAELQSLLEPDAVTWSLEERTVAGSYRLRNTGTIEARSVTVNGYPAGMQNLLVAHREHPTLAPGATFVFNVSNRLTVTLKEVEIMWIDSTSAETRREVLRLP